MLNLTITESAQTHFKKLLENQLSGTQIRVFVINPGMPSAECGVAYCPTSGVEEQDARIQFNGFLVYIDEMSLPFLDDAVIDFVTDELGSQLTLKAPNAKMRKVANDAPLIERIEYLIQTKINPQLESHGGYVSLIEITEDNVVVVRFGGGCNGCSMIDVTLKEGIEKELKTAFPEIVAVKDLTDHQRGDHSFY